MNNEEDKLLKSCMQGSRETRYSDGGGGNQSISNPNLVVERIEFIDGGTLDGPFLSQILRKLNDATIQTEIKRKIIYFSNISLTPVSIARSCTLCFENPVSVQAIAGEFNDSVPAGTTYYFGNLSNNIVRIYKNIQGVSTLMLSIVPGEFVDYVKLPGASNRWFGKMG